MTRGILEKSFCFSPISCLQLNLSFASGELKYVDVFSWYSPNSIVWMLDIPNKQLHKEVQNISIKLQMCEWSSLLVSIVYVWNGL